MNSDICTIGVIGAGAISGIYLKNLTGVMPGVRVKCVSAAHFERAQKKAEEYGVLAVTTEEMLSDPEVDMVLVLTPVDTHYALIRAALTAGKHVYTEKTITQTSEEAAELRRLAAERGLYLGCAPDTVLGASLQTARKALEDGVIGEVTGFSACITRSNDFLTGYLPFLRLPGAGALRDYLIYYLNALVSLLGPVAEVSAKIRTPYPTRVNPVPGTPDYGKEIPTPNESIVTAWVELESGLTGTLTEMNETILHDLADFMIYGREGVLLLGCPNNFGDPVRILKNAGRETPVPQPLPMTELYAENSRGVGPAEMAAAIREGRPSRMDASRAAHLLDVIEAMEESDRTGRSVRVESTCDKPAGFEGM